ncbi:MAG: FxsA family protein [Porticoccaceae bacterium]|nr:FxsA family protein [Porticoccaceae bacterium]
MRILFLLFIVMPVLEMWLLITVGSQIGALATIGLVLLTAVVGAGLLREQGVATLWRGQRKLQEGQLPAQEIVEGIVLAVSGALLLTPGFFTDAVGFAGLIPPVRALFVRTVLSKMVVAPMPRGSADFNHQQGIQDADIIEGEAWDENKDRD